MRFQIIHEDDKHFKIHDTKSKSHFVVAKKGLSSDFIAHAQKLCGGGMAHYSDGTGPDGASLNDVKSRDDSGSRGLNMEDLFGTPGKMIQGLADRWDGMQNNIDNAEQGKVAPMSSTPGGEVATTGNPLSAAPPPQAPLDSGESATPSPDMKTPTLDPSNNPTQMADQKTQSLDQIAKNEKGALYGIARAKEKEGQTTASAAENMAAQSQRAFDDMQKAHADIEAENHTLREGIMNQKIDPSRVWHNMSTTGKITSAISLILGGIGGALTRSPNAGLSVLQGIIDKDIQAQKDELGKKQTLYSMNLDRYKNANMAYSATMLNLGNVAKAQMEAAAARSGSEQAMKIAQLQGAQIDERLAPVKQQLAVQRFTLQNADPIGRQIRVLVPEKEQAKVYSEVEKAQNAVKIRDSLVNEFQKADKQNTLVGRAMHLGFTPQAVANIKAMMVPLLKDEAGRVTEPELARVDGFIPSPGDSRQKVDEKFKGMLEFVDAKAATPVASSYGIKINGGRFDERGQSKIKEAPPVLK